MLYCAGKFELKSNFIVAVVEELPGPAGFELSFLQALNKVVIAQVKMIMTFFIHRFFKLKKVALTCEAILIPKFEYPKIFIFKKYFNDKSGVMVLVRGHNPCSK